MLNALVNALENALVKDVKCFGQWGQRLWSKGSKGLKALVKALVKDVKALVK